MKRYTGKLSTETSRLIQQYKSRLEKLIQSKGLGRVSENKVYTLEESLEVYNSGISIDEIKAWVWYRRKNGIPMTNWKKYFTEPSKSELAQWVKNGVLFFDATNGGELVPYPIFVFGNLYEKIAKTKANQESIENDFGISVFKNHIQVLENLKPKPLSITNPVEGERPVILAISETADNFIVNSLKDIPLSEPSSLREAYKDWLRNQSEEVFKKTNAREIINYYLENESKPRFVDKIEWGAIKKKSRDEGERLFKVFLHEALEYTDQVRIDAEYNSRFNAVAPLQFQKIPVALEISKKFKGFDLRITPAQSEGVAFIELVGSGIIAYDVGVGKTITAIINIANALNCGKCKRPLVVVPNPTYKNWIKEILGDASTEGILTGTGITINEWYNLGSDYDHVDLNKKVPERSITLVTYEGLEKIGFNEYTANDHFNELSDILEQNTEGTEREREKGYEKLREIIGVGNKETICDIETLGIDFIVVDEAHNFKNVFSEVKSDEKNGKQFQIQGGQPSNRAIKLFFVTNYIQRKYGRNVVLLTATPFTNSPLEIYSMLSFVAYNYMKSWGIYNIRTFFEQYIQETYEYVVGMDGEIEQKAVVKSFNNRISLQKLINSHISFKTGEEANVPRPCKINLPKTTIVTEEGIRRLPTDEQILTYIKLSPLQEKNQQEINILASEGANRDEPGKLLSLMGESLNNAMSPYLVGKSKKTYVSFLKKEPKDYFEFVEESPKIKYAIECIRSVKKWHEKRNEPVSGQIIYMDRGKDYFHYIKEYLEKELGYKKGVPVASNPNQKVDEVEVVSSGISQDKKEKIKTAFNDGSCKIIIGTSTIKEGINLQSKSTVLQNLYPNWNPTDIRQIEGRLWRQGNMFGYVRIVMPLMENSMDVFVFQKLEEKTSRINDLWSKADRGNVLDEASLDPNEVKFALVTDLNVLMRFELKQLNSDLASRKQVIENKIRDLGNYVYLASTIENYRQSVFNRLTNWLYSFKNETVFRNASNEPVFFEEVSKYTPKMLESLTKEKQYRIEKFKDLYQTLNNLTQGYTDKDLILAASSYMRLVLDRTYDSSLDNYKEKASQFAKIKKTIFERGYNEGTDLSIIKDEFEKELISIEAEQKELSTPEFQMKLMDKIKKEKAKYSIKGGDLKDRVRDFESLNYVMSWRYANIDKNSCSIPTKEYAGTNTPPVDNNKKLQLAKAKAKAIQIRLRLIKQKN